MYLMEGSWWIVKAMFGGRLCSKQKTFPIRKASPKEKKCACHLARVLLHVCVCICVCVCLCVFMYMNTRVCHMYMCMCTCACCPVVYQCLHIHLNVCIITVRSSVLHVHFLPPSIVSTAILFTTPRLCFAWK